MLSRTSYLPPHTAESDWLHVSSSHAVYLVDRLELTPPTGRETQGRAESFSVRSPIHSAAAESPLWAWHLNTSGAAENRRSCYATPQLP